MNTALQAVKVAVYNNLTTAEKPVYVSLFDVYKGIKEAYFAETELIQNEFRINGKSPLYKSLKVAKLKAATFHLNGCSRHDNVPSDSPSIHSGRITLDIDEGTEFELRTAAAFCKTLPFVEALALSASGFLNVSFWANVLIEMPKSKGLLRMDVANMCHSKTWVSDLHKLFYQAAKVLIERPLGSSCIGASNDLKRSRSLAHDPNIYINENARQITLVQLYELIDEGLLPNSKTKEPNRDFGGNSPSIPIKLDDSQLERALQLAVDYANRQGYSYIDGSRHLYQVHLAIKLNSLGIAEEQASYAIKEFYPREQYNGLGNAVSSVYARYRDTHGVQQYQLKLNRKEFQLNRDETMSSYANELCSAILSDKKLIVQAPTGTGKTYAFTQPVSDILVGRGFTCIFVEPTTLLAEQVASKIGTKAVTAAAFNSGLAERLLEGTKIVCNYANFPKVAEILFNRGLKIIPFIDECHCLEEGAIFKDNNESHRIDLLLNDCDFAVLYSATPTSYKAYEGYKALTFTQADRQPIYVHPRTYKGRISKEALQFIRDNSTSENLLLLRINSKDTIEQIKDVLLSSYNEEEVLCIYSDEKIKNTEAFLQLSNADKSDSFDKSVRVVLCTSLIDCGLSIYEERQLISAFFTDNVHDTRAFIQFADRHRTGKEKEIYYFYNDDTTEELLKKAIEDNDQDSIDWYTDQKKKREMEFNPIKHYLNEIERFTERATHRNKEFANFGREIVNDLSRRESEIVFDRVTNRFECSRIGVAARVEHARNVHRSFSRFCSELPGYFVVDEKSHIAPITEIVEAAKRSRKKFELIRADAESQIVEVLGSEDRGAFMYLVGKKTCSTSVSNSVRTAMSKEHLRAIEAKYRHLFEHLGRCLIGCERLLMLEAIGVSYQDAVEILFCHERTFSAKLHRISSFVIRGKSDNELSAPDRVAKIQIDAIALYLQESSSKGKQFDARECSLFVSTQMQKMAKDRYKNRLCGLSSFVILQYAQGICKMKFKRHRTYQIGEIVNCVQDIIKG